MIARVLTILCFYLAGCTNIDAQPFTSDDIWINEYKYLDFVEIACTSTVMPFLNGFAVVFLQSLTSVRRFTLDTGEITKLDGRNIELLTVPFPLDHTDNIGIVLRYGTTAIQFISFNTAITYTGIVSTPISASPNALTVGAGSLQLTGNGCKYSDFTSPWTFNTDTRYAENNGQVLCRNNGSGGGDPHFRTFDGTKYSFHGQCDLVMVRTESMGSMGLPFAIHARTTLQSWYSYISQTALQIGSDTFEITANGQYYLNGQMDVELPQLMAGKYQISKKENIVIKAKKQTNSSLGFLTRVVYKIQLDGQDYIEISRFKEMIYVKVNARLPNSEGMLGKQGMIGLIGRDGITVMKDANAMGMEWQVRDDELQLFVHDINRAPQYPEQCTYPSVTGRSHRMLRSNKDYEHAKIACDNIEDRELQEFCIEDILITGDFDLVNAYSY